MDTSKTNSQTIDVTPTWEACVPWLVAGLQDGNDKGVKASKENLLHMARVADKLLPLAKQAEIVYSCLSEIGGMNDNVYQQLRKLKEILATIKIK